MKFNVNKLFYYAFISVLFAVFVFGGVIQFFIGVSSTGYSLAITLFMYVLIFFDLILRRKLFLSKVLYISILYLLLVLVSGFVNGSNFLKVILYSIFPLTPLGVFYLCKILEKREISKKNIIFSFFRAVSLIQLPIILVQKYGFDFFIKFNQSSQFIHEYDFMFGTFFIRADHSLGFFILMYIINIIFKIRRNEITRVPWVLLAYLTLTVFLMESNLTKLMLIFVVGYYMFLWLYSKVKVVGIVLMIFIAALLFKVALSVGPIKEQYNYVQNKYTKKVSIAAYNKGYAKRPQVVIAYLTCFPIKFIGDGPYNYFNIFEGVFKQTKHFSQLIWTYNDLGLLGLLVVSFLSLYMIKSLSVDNKSIVLILFVFFAYLFLTNIFSDLAMMLSLNLLISKTKDK